MKTGSAANDDYGLGLKRAYTACGLAYGHEGDFPGYRNAVWATPNGRRVADVMINIDPTHVSWTSLEAAAQTALCSGWASVTIPAKGLRTPLLCSRCG
jgi:hypothetical protein